MCINKLLAVFAAKTPISSKEVKEKVSKMKAGDTKSFYIDLDDPAFQDNESIAAFCSSISYATNLTSYTTHRRKKKYILFKVSLI